MSYVGVDVLGTREERGAEIEDVFGFVCACEACVLDETAGEESDGRRVAIRTLFEEIGACGKEPAVGLKKVRIVSQMLPDGAGAACS